MLSAQKEEIQLTAETTLDDLPNVGSFGRVVNSIQGLQQRLESFSADDIGNAHDKTQTLLLRLSNLQEKLATFAEIKVFIAIARDAIEQALRDCADIGKLDAPETQAFIQTLTQANKLIQFPRLNKTGETPGTQPAASTDESISTHAQGQDNDPSTPSVAEKSETVDAAQSLEAVNPAPLPSHPTIQTDIATVTVVTRDNDPENQLASQVVDLSSATVLEPLLTPEVETLPVDEPQIDICRSAASESSDASTQASPLLASPADETPENLAPPAATPDFDQRLLDDLIRNYGEFVVSGSCPRTSDAPDTPPVNTAETPAVPSTVRSTEIELERNNLPSIKRDGDLDRELKKLIKDYGEYDLYSRQSPINLKTGVIAAFLLLALIFSGFYYFSPKALSSQNSTAPQSRPSTSAGSSDQDSLADRPGATAAETGSLHATGNNARPKNRP